MGDQPKPIDPEGGVKRQLGGDQLDATSSGQPSTANQSATTNGEEIKEDNPHEQASKRIKLDLSEQSPRLDSRDKVKGTALIKPE